MKKLLSVMVVVIITTGILLMNTEIILATNDIEITTSNTKNNTINQNVKENQVTVSYTHLDVYKRQGKNRIIRGSTN